MNRLAWILVVVMVVACKGKVERDPEPARAPAEAPAVDAAPTPVALGVVTAVDYEYQAVRGLLTATVDSVLAGRQVADGTVGGKRIVVIRSGWGKAHAAGATALLLERYRPARVLMAGIGGGLRASAATSGDIVIIDGTFQHDLGGAYVNETTPWPPESPTEEERASVYAASPLMVSALWRALSHLRPAPWMLPPGCKCQKNGTPQDGACAAAPQRVGREQPRACVGTAATGDVFLADPRAAAIIAERARGVIVDMETAAVAQECANHGVDFAGIRVVADVVAADGESLYYCLKPQSGPRLAEAMAAALPALLDPDATAAEPLPVEALCAPTLTVAKVEEALLRERAALVARPMRADLRLH